MRLSPGSTLALLFLLAGLALIGLPRSRMPRSNDGIDGRVLDEDGPIIAASVRLKGTAIHSRTDARGRFHFTGRQAGKLDPRITACKDGYFIGGTRWSDSPLIHLVRLPRDDNENYQWVDPRPGAAESHNCGNCHAEIYREWSHSGHAHSLDGRRFRNLYEGTDWNGKPGVGWGLLTQYPDGIGVCAACHAPTSEAFDLRQVKGTAGRGVHCDYCHKIADVAGGTLGLSHGRFNLRLLRPTEGQLFFGSLDDVDRGDDAYSPLYRDSRYCASCHEGVVFGVHVYSTYSEWLQSPARREGKQCQDCHMKPTGLMNNIAPGRGGIRRDPHTLANHRFFDESQEAMVRRAVKTSVHFERSRDETRARVRLWAEGVGHRLPTGFIDRHLILVIEGKDSAGRMLPLRAGVKLPPLAGAEFADRPGRLFARLLKDEDGRSPAPFWSAAPDPPTDTRLIPGRIEEMEFVFPSSLASVWLRVIYRRFWIEVARAKGWPDEDVLVIDEVQEMGRK